MVSPHTSTRLLDGKLRYTSPSLYPLRATQSSTSMSPHSSLTKNQDSRAKNYCYSGVTTKLENIFPKSSPSLSSFYPFNQGLSLPPIAKQDKQNQNNRITLGGEGFVLGLRARARTSKLLTRAQARSRYRYIIFYMLH